MSILNEDSFKGVKNVVYAFICVCPTLIYKKDFPTNTVLVKVGMTNGPLRERLREPDISERVSHLFILGVVKNPKGGVKNYEKKMHKLLQEKKFSCGVVENTFKSMTEYFIPDSETFGIIKKAFSKFKKMKWFTKLDEKEDDPLNIMSEQLVEEEIISLTAPEEEDALDRRTIQMLKEYDLQNVGRIGSGNARKVLEEMMWMWMD
jgi:hypothetical protein